MNIQVQLKQAGKRKNSIRNVMVELEALPETVGQLIQFTVKACIKGFRQKKAGESRLFCQEELEDAASTGKIAFDFFYGNTEVDEQQAVLTALQAFEDGMIAVFVNGELKSQLSDHIELTKDSTVTFVKLVMLAGRMW